MAATNTKNFFKLVYWNANGLLSKKHELMHFLEEEEVDVIMIGETWLNNNHMLKIPNYSIYRNDRIHNPRGGTAIAIKRTLPHSELPTRRSGIEHTILEVNLQQPIQLISAYSSPNYDITQADLQELIPENVTTVLLGGLNAKEC